MQRGAKRWLLSLPARNITFSESGPMGQLTRETVLRKAKMVCEQFVTDLGKSRKMVPSEADRKGAPICGFSQSGSWIQDMN